MSESRKNFTENINHTKLKELKDYVLTFKDVKDQFYDPKVHTDWEEMVIFIPGNKLAKWCVFQIYIEEENYFIYTFSDENGNVTLPNKEAEEFENNIIYTNDELIFNELFKEIEQQQQPQKTKSKYTIGGIIVVLLIGYVSFILPVQMREYKLQKEQKLISDVIAKPYADYENNKSLIINKLHSIKKENHFIYVYTNDTEPLDFRILPNIQVYQNTDNYPPHFGTNQIQENELQWFIDNEHTEGYNIWLNTSRAEIHIGNLNENKATEFNISMTYFYSKRSKEYIKKRAKKRKKSQFLNSIIKDPDSIQTARVIVSKEFEIKPRNKLGSLLMGVDEDIIQSAIKEKNPTKKIYLSFYSKNGSKKDLECKIEKFEKVFYDAKKSKDYKIRKVYLKR